jgi:ribosomal protein S27AE
MPEANTTPPLATKPPVAMGQLVRFSATKSVVARDADRCPKCKSVFIEHEPAFLHCKYCGNMARIVDGSLMDQDLHERRSGLKIAS